MKDPLINIIEMENTTKLLITHILSLNVDPYLVW